MVQPCLPKAVRWVVESGAFWGHEQGGLPFIVFAGVGVRNEVMVDSQVMGWKRVNG